MDEKFLNKIVELQNLFDEGVVTTADNAPQPEPRQDVVDREAINRFMRDNPMAEGGRINFDGGGSPLQKFKQEIVESMKPYAPGDITEDQLQLIVRDITLDMTAEQAQASALSNFRKLFSMADGGMLVQSSVDGSRPGYAEKRTDKLEQRQKAYEKFLKETDYLGTDKEFEKIQEDAITKKTGSGVKPPSVQARFKKVTKYLEKLIPKLNAEDRFYTKDEVSAMVEKKFNIKPRRNEFGFKINQFLNRDYPIMRTLDKSDVKLENLIGKMLMEDKPLNDFFFKSLQKRLNLGDRVVSDLLKESPFFNTLKDSGIDSLVYSFNREKPHGFLKKLSLSDQLRTALEMEQGLPRYTNISGEDVRARSPKFTVMDFAKRSWNQNKGKGAIQFFDKNGKLINWSFNLQLPYNEVSFKYNGKKYNSKILNNTLLLKKNFPEVYENQMALNKLKNTRITDPLNKNKTITVANLVKRNQIKNYNWSPDKSSFDILHSTKGVKNEPFTNLSFNTSDINTIERGITESAVLNKNQKNKIIKNIDKVYGSGDPDVITKRQIDLAKSKNIIDYQSMKGDVLKQTVTKKDFNNFRNLLNNLAGELNPTCRKKVAEGGRINFEYGSVACQAEAKKYVKESLARGIDPKATDIKSNIVKKILRSTVDFAKGALDPKQILNLKEQFFSRGAVAGTVLFDGLIAADSAIRKGKPIQEALQDTFALSVFAPSQNIIDAQKVLDSPTASSAAKDYAQRILTANELKEAQKNLEDMPTDKGFFGQKVSDLQQKLKGMEYNRETGLGGEVGKRDFESELANILDKDTATLKEGLVESQIPFIGSDKPDQIAARKMKPVIEPSAKRDYFKTLGDKEPSPFLATELPTRMVLDMPPAYDKAQLDLPTEDEVNKISEILNVKLTPQETSDLINQEKFRQLFETPGFTGSQQNFNKGGIAGLSGGDKSGPPPERGPNSEGLSGLLKRGTNT